jgi:hypothetical protein
MDAIERIRPISDAAALPRRRETAWPRRREMNPLRHFGKAFNQRHEGILACVTDDGVALVADRRA